MDDIDRFLKAPDFYSALGLNRKTFTDKQVDQAFKKFAVKFHPDKNKNPKAEEAFKKLVEIKDTLKTPSKRNIYDQTTFSSTSYIHKPRASHTFAHRQNEPNDYIYGFWHSSSAKAKRPNLKKKKNKLLPVIMILVLLALFTFIANTEPFTGSITKESLSKVIKFSLDGSNPLDFTIYYSKIIQVKFFIPKEWEKDYIYGANNGSDWQNLIEQIRIYADEIYKEKLIAECEKEQKSSMRSHPSCVRLKTIS